MSLAQYKQFKKTADEDKDRGALNAHHAGLAGALAGVLAKRGPLKVPGRALPLDMTTGKRAVAGYLAGQLAVTGVRVATSGTKDTYGDRSRAAKKAEKLPALAGLVGAGLLAKKRLGNSGLAAKIRNFDGSHNQRLIRMEKPKRKRGSGIVAQGLVPCEFSMRETLDEIARRLAKARGIAGKPAISGYLRRKAAWLNAPVVMARRVQVCEFKVGNRTVYRAATTVAAGGVIGAARRMLARSALPVAEIAGGDIIAEKLHDDWVEKKKRREALAGAGIKQMSATWEAIYFHYGRQLRRAASESDPGGGSSLGGAYVNPLEAKAKGIAVKEGGMAVEIGNRHLVPAAYATGRRYATVGRRGVGLTSDAVGVLRGKEKVDSRGRPVKREWEKQWFKTAVTSAAIGVGLIGVTHARSYARANPATAVGKTVMKTEEKIAGAKDWVRKKTGFAAQLRGLILFDAWAEEKGWDVRDPRGRSARVFAPGSRRRERREKTWSERVENIRKLALIGGAGALAVGLGGGVLIGRRMGHGAPRLPAGPVKVEMPKPPVGRKAKPKVPPVQAQATGTHGPLATGAHGEPIAGKPNVITDFLDKLRGRKPPTS